MVNCQLSDKNNEGLTDPLTHLAGYMISETDADGGDLDSQSDGEFVEILITNEFGDDELELKSSKRLLVPPRRASRDRRIRYRTSSPTASWWITSSATTLTRRNAHPSRGRRGPAQRRPSLRRREAGELLDLRQTRMTRGLQHPEDHLVCYDIELMPGFCSADANKNSWRHCQVGTRSRHRGTISRTRGRVRPQPVGGRPTELRST